MKQYSVTASILSALTLCWAADTQPDPKATPEYQRGRELSQVYCTACHVYPEPDQHDVATWRTKVEPWMRRKAGMLALDPKGSKEEKEALEQWRLIWDYYSHAAPTKAIPQGPRAPIRRELKSFNVEDPRYRRGISYATMVQIDSNSHQIYVGNAFTRSLDVLDANGKGLATTRIDSTLTHLLQLPGGDWLGTQIGMVVPDDRPLGRLTRFARPGLRFQVVNDVLTGLVRPIGCAVGDLNGDGRQDLIVCSFGNRPSVSGQLAWYENSGEAGFEEHVLLAQPGAIRSYVVDLDRDGRPDIVALTAAAKEGVFLFHNEGQGVLTEIPLLPQSPAWGYGSLQLVDFNGDGELDLLTANGDLGEFECPPKRYHGVRIYLNHKNFKFHEAFFYPLNGAGKAVAADFNGDGKLDIAVISFFPDYERSPEESFVYLENRGKLEFDAWTFPDSERGRWLTMDVGDLDGDGDLDIVLGAAYKTPFRTTNEIQARWDKEGPSLLILRNQLAERKAKAGAPEAAKP